MVSLTLQYGTHDASAMGYAAFGRMLGPVFGRYQDGYRFGKLGYDLNERLKLTAYKARIVDLFGISTTFWVQPIAVGLEYAQVAYHSANEVGDLTYACYARMHIPFFMCVKGEPLEAIQREAERSLDYVRGAGYDEVTDIITCIQRLVFRLQGRTNSISTFTDEHFSQSDFEKHLKKNRSGLTNSWYQVLKCAAEVFAQHFAEAAATAENTAPLLSNTQLMYPEHFYYRALAVAAVYDSVSPSQQVAFLKVLHEHSDQLKIWAENNPVSYYNKYALVAAEYARVQGHREDAMRLFDEAIQAAHADGFIHNEALGCERASDYYRGLGLISIADGYLNRAITCYKQWGAWAKVKQLHDQNPTLSEGPLAPTATFLAQPEYFDVLSVSSASQAISREMDPIKLQQSLMRIVIEHSAAEQVSLFLIKENNLFLQASGQVKSGVLEIKTELDEPIDANSDLPHRVINYTWRSKETVLLDDAKVHPLFGNDLYIQTHAAKSLLCLPIARGDELVGIFLLENSLIAGIFSPGKLKILELLAAQAAISLDNAYLYNSYRKSQAELQSILDNASAVMFIKDLGGQYLLVNQQFEALFKLTKTHVIGKTDTDIFPREYAEIVQRNDQKVITDGKSHTSEVLLPVDSELRTYLALKFPLLTDEGKIYAVCGISSDITDRKQNEAMLYEQKERAEVTLQSIGDAVITTDASGRIDYLNPVAQQLTGWGLDQALGLPLIDVLKLVDEDNGQPLPNPIAEVLADGNTHRLPRGCLLIRHDGTRSAIEDSAAPILGRDGGIIGTVLVFHDVSESRKITAELAYQATHDVLTGLPNRTLLADRLAQAIVSGKRHGNSVGVMFLDLDRFKKINDSLGHTAGDELLQEVVARLETLMRAEDTISRFGGDEFLILTPNITKRSRLADLARKLLEEASLPYVVGRHELRVTFSIGISVYPDDGSDAETLIKNADSAMYHAKQSGRDNFQFYTEEMNVKALERLSMEVSLRRALTREEFVVFYQPKTDAATREVIGAEALVRWNHPKLGMIMPGSFIDIAEESGLIASMGDWVTEQVCSQNQAWLQSGLHCVPISVNLSAVQFRDKLLPQAIKRVLEKTGLPPYLLELELTESVLMPGTDNVSAILEDLKKLGIGLSIDDFGTGYSSLSYLKRFPIDTLKIDQAFLRDVTWNEDDAAIIKAIIGMGHSLRMKVIAEGVETVEQFEFLKTHRCDQVQGYYFGRPVSATAFEQLLKKKLH